MNFIHKFKEHRYFDTILFLLSFNIIPHNYLLSLSSKNIKVNFC